MDFPIFYTCEFSSSFLNRLDCILCVVVHLFLLEANSSEVANQVMSIGQSPNDIYKSVAQCTAQCNYHKFVVNV